MSEYMLCDQDTINDINPFVSRDFSLPGGVRQLGDFADRSLVKEKSGMEVQEEKSPYCKYARAEQLCNPQKPNCFDARPLYPQRNIDYGFTVARNTNPGGHRRARRGIRFDLIFIFIISIIAILLILRR